MLLGTVTPSLIKYATGNLTDNGKTVGTIEACGTIGSILGTFLPTFITIPNFGTAATFYIFSAILALLAFLYFLSAGKGAVKGGVAAGVIITLLFIPFDYSFAFWEKGLVCEGESIYNYLRVREDPESVILSTNVLEGVQSIYKKSGGLTGMYYDYALAAPLMADTGNEEPHLLILGMGTGTYAKQCRSYGRAYLRNAGTYDVIMVDAYQDITIPFHMSTTEFFGMVKEHLNPGGVMVVNMNMMTDQEGGINDYLIDTICSVFPEVVTVTVGNNTNQELFAGEKSGLAERLAERISQMDEDDPLKYQMETVLKKLVREEGGNYILTDDKAPVELLGMQALDNLISSTLESYGGIENLL